MNGIFGENFKLFRSFALPSLLSSSLNVFFVILRLSVRKTHNSWHVRVVSTILQRIFLGKVDHIDFTHSVSSLFFVHFCRRRMVCTRCSKSGHKNKVFAKEIFITLPHCHYFCYRHCCSLLLLYNRSFRRMQCSHFIDTYLCHASLVFHQNVDTFKVFPLAFLRKLFKAQQRAIANTICGILKWITNGHSVS